MADYPFVSADGRRFVDFGSIRLTAPTTYLPRILAGENQWFFVFFSMRLTRTVWAGWGTQQDAEALARRLDLFSEANQGQVPVRPRPITHQGYRMEPLLSFRESGGTTQYKCIMTSMSDPDVIIWQGWLSPEQMFNQMREVIDDSVAGADWEFIVTPRDVPLMPEAPELDNTPDSCPVPAPASFAVDPVPNPSRDAFYPRRGAGPGASAFLGLCAAVLGWILPRRG